MKRPRWGHVPPLDLKNSLKLSFNFIWAFEVLWRPTLNIYQFIFSGFRQVLPLASLWCHLSVSNLPSLTNQKRFLIFAMFLIGWIWCSPQFPVVAGVAQGVIGVLLVLHLHPVATGEMPPFAVYCDSTNSFLNLYNQLDLSLRRPAAFSKPGQSGVVNVIWDVQGKRLITSGQTRQSWHVNTISGW